MKKVLLKAIALALCAGLLLNICGCTFSSKKAEPVSIYFASDMHFLSPSLTDGGEYFMELIASADGKVTHYSNEVVDAFFDEVKTAKPDLLILGGDLTLNGSQISHNEFAGKLAEVQNAGIQVLVIPGNHDLNSAAYRFEGEELITVDYTPPEKFAEIYKGFGYEQAVSRDEATFSFVYEPTDGLKIIMLDTNSVRKGYVQDSTLSWLEGELKKAKRSRDMVISVTHQNLFVHNELLSFGYEIYNSNKLLELYKKYDVKLNLSGHIHVQNIVEKDGITEVAVSSTLMTPIQYGAIDFDGKNANYTSKEIDVEGYAEKIGSKNEDLLNFSAYAKDFFEKLSKNQVRMSFAESELDDKQIELLADTFAEINTAYFAGDAVDAANWEEGLKLWEGQGTFFNSYIKTMTARNYDCKSVSVNLK